MTNKLLFLALIVVVFCGCGKKSPIERSYIKELFCGHWEGNKITIVSPSKDSLSKASLHFHVENYGWMKCLFNQDDTYKLDLAITSDIYGRDVQGQMDYGHVLIPAGYKLLTTGHFTYQDSTVKFINYRNEMNLCGILYSYNDDMYLTYIDKYQNEWNIQFVRTN